MTTWPICEVCLPTSGKFDLKFKPKKCALFHWRVEFWGRQVSPQGVEMGDSCVEAVQNWAASRSTKDVERFWGFIERFYSWLRSIGISPQPLDREETFHLGAGAASRR